MEVVSIDKKTFDAMLSRFEIFAARMEMLCRLNRDMGISEWLDNQDVCKLLNISPRTVQTLRDNGALAFTKISHKVYYKPADVERVVPLVEKLRDVAAYRGKNI